MSLEVANRYPDMYLRGSAGEQLLRIDCKVLDVDSAEYSARFDVALSAIRPREDTILYIAWGWEETTLAGAPIVYPHLAEALVVPAMAIGLERDRHLRERGGWLDPADESPRVPPNGEIDTNYGKINRIVHRNRRSADDLDPSVRAFMEFVARNVPGAGV